KGSTQARPVTVASDFPHRAVDEHPKPSPSIAVARHVAPPWSAAFHAALPGLPPATRRATSYRGGMQKGFLFGMQLAEASSRTN
ncbi:MAG: hypothetical protein ACR2MC_10185, partial [Actinomycetota bacterium]